MTKLIIQIPCFNEVETLPSVIEGLPREITGITEIEILVIDDGGRNIAKRLGVDHVIRHRTNRGLAAARAHDHFSGLVKLPYGAQSTCSLHVSVLAKRKSGECEKDEP